jgi:hypothetical protein
MKDDRRKKEIIQKEKHEENEIFPRFEITETIIKNDTINIDDEQNKKH